MKADPKNRPTRPGKPLYFYARLGVHGGIPPFVRYCKDFILKHGLSVQGILRLSGTEEVIEEVKKAFETNPDVELNLKSSSKDIMAVNVASALKQFVRNLAEPVIPFESYNQFISIDDNKTDLTPQKRRLLQRAIRSLPKLNQILLREICDLCRAIANQSDINLMTSSNCAVVWSPNLIESERPLGLSELGAELAKQQRIIQWMIDDYARIFEGLIKLEIESAQSIHQVSSCLAKTSNSSSWLSSLKGLEGVFQRGALPALLGLMVPKLGDALPTWSAPKLHTFEELKKGVSPSSTNDELKLIGESLVRMKVNELCQGANDLSALVTMLTQNAGLTPTSPELDEIFALVGRSLDMLADWIVVEAQEIFRCHLFTPEWLANKFGTMKAMEQLQAVLEGVRHLKSEAHRDVVVSQITRRLLGQYLLAFAQKIPALRAAKVDESKLKIRLNEDDELIINTFGEMLRLAQSSTQELEREVIKVLAAIPALFAPDVRNIVDAVRTIENYIGPAEALPALTDMLQALRKDRKHEELLKGLEKRSAKANVVSRWLLDVQVKSVALVEPPKNKCDLALTFRAGGVSVGTTVLKDVRGNNGGRSTSEERWFDSVVVEVKTSQRFLTKVVGTAQLSLDTIRQELILSSNFSRANTESEAGDEDTSEEKKSATLSAQDRMHRFKEVNRHSVEPESILNTKYFNLELEICHDSQVVGSLSLALRYIRNPYMAMSMALKSDAGKHDTLWELNGDPTAESLVDCMVALRDIPDRWHLGVEHYLDKNQGDQEVTNGFQSMLAALKDLYYIPNERWLAVRDKVEVGLVKATRNCGNTSVSMGLAEVYLSRELKKPNGHRTVAFLNCGTGGVKMQMYACKRDGVVFALMEAKPRKCSLSAVEISGYVPKQEVLDAQGIAQPLRVEEFVGMLDDELKKAPWNRKELEAPMRKFLDAQNQAPPEVFAFITGSIRGYWAKGAAKTALESVVSQMFAGRALPATAIVDPESTSYFIKQQVEGAMELVAAKSMYKYIGFAVPQYRDKEVVASLGIGSGSSQWTDQRDTVSIPHGMLSQYLLSNLGRDIVKHYRDPANFEHFVSSVEKVSRPIIALKSGCLLQLHDKKVGAGLRSRLCFGDSPDDGEEQSRSLARVCAEAGAALGSHEHFLKAEIRGDRIVFLSPYPGNMSFTEFASEGKLENWQENPLAK